MRGRPGRRRRPTRPIGRTRLLGTRARVATPRGPTTMAPYRPRRIFDHVSPVPNGRGCLADRRAGEERVRPDFAWRGYLGWFVPRVHAGGVRRIIGQQIRM